MSTLEDSPQTPKEEQIRDLIKSITDQEVNGIAQINVGIDSTVFNISTNKGELILRTGGGRSNYDVEHELLARVRSKGVKAPKPIASSIDLKMSPFTYSLLEKFPGTSLNEAPSDIWPQVLKEVGGDLAKLHDIKLDGFGIIDPTTYRESGQLKGRRSSWYEALVGGFSFRLEETQKKIVAERNENFVNSTLPVDIQQKLLQIMNRVDEVWQRVSDSKSSLDIKGSLVHGDVHMDHIFVDQGSLVGLIDFNAAMVGDPLFDSAYFSVMEHGELYPHILEGSKETVDQRRFHLYRLLIAVGKIHTRYVANNYLHKSPQILDFALEELNR
jgi:aminoglycoside phosphotransferase (APT) family kinase protein